jgi:hypothetical protein
MKFNIFANNIHYKIIKIQCMSIYYYKFNTISEIDVPPKKRKRVTSINPKTLIIKAQDISSAQNKAEIHIKHRKTYNHNLPSYELVLTHIL